ncbi:MAG: fatty acid metabolism transcriptional regulator FadR [Anaerolineae bacterium]|jgi:GntR family negative regulator for fad regulon and positive regulator of fabA|nr:fatty acid metabolism transcriptional regulator FadR [Anaerolineae bacterium]
MSNWSAPQRPAAYAEEALLTAILDGTYPPGSTLPGERDLAAQLGVTRPTLRETLQRLACDGWLTIQQGKSTRVNDFWQEGGLNVLGALVSYSRRLPPNFVSNLLEVRLALAPAYTRAAVIRGVEALVGYLAGQQALDDTPRAMAAFDWGLHRTLTIASGNPVYTLILNGFAGFYEEMACLYFALDEARASSRAFYAALAAMVSRGDADGAERLVREVMQESIALWNQAATGEGKDETMERLGG